MSARLRAALLSCVLLMVCVPGTARGDEAPTPLVSVDGAFVAREADGGWVIGNGAIRYRVGTDATGQWVARGLERPAAGVAWRLGQSPDFALAVHGRRVVPGQIGVPFRQATAGTYRSGVRLDASFEDVASRLRITRTYVCYPAAPVIETWTTFEVVAGAAGVLVGDLTIWQLSPAVDAAHWVSGLQATAAEGGRFSRRRQSLTDEGALALGSTSRSSEHAIPTAWFSGDAGHVLGAALWSGAWALSASAPEASGLSAIRLSLGQTATTVSPGTPVDTPHGIFGAVGVDETEVPRAIEVYVRTGLRQGRRFEPKVTYNTWYAYGTSATADALAAEMEQAAAVGAERFVVDAGWYPTSADPAEFATGLGLWTVDTRRFPDGLGPLRERAHALGLSFGLWVEPERVDTATVGKAGLAQERFLATVGGRYNAGVKNDHADAAQICLADAQAREWVFARLVALIEAVQPDYLKWDNNYWINCDRTGHGHGARDGNFGHTAGLYTVLRRLRERFPDLVIENCASGGNRLDLGMLEHTDVAWMDDVSAPSSHVRHNLEGLGAVFPPAYLLSFVMDHAAEAIHGAADMALYYRSRMAGVLGLSLRGAEFDDDDRAAMRREIALYKSARDTTRDAVLVPLTEQVAAGSADRWDAIEWYAPDASRAVVFAFAGAEAGDSVTVRPLGLRTNERYAISAPRRGSVARVLGSTLMTDGITFRRNPYTAGYVLMLEVVPE